MGSGPRGDPVVEFCQVRIRVEGSTARVSNSDILITFTIDSHIVVLVLQVEEHHPQILQLTADWSSDN